MPVFVVFCFCFCFNLFVFFTDCHLRVHPAAVCVKDKKLLVHMDTSGVIHSTKISGNFGPKLNGSVRSNRKSFEKTGPSFEVDHFSWSDRLEFWLNGSHPSTLSLVRVQQKLCSILCNSRKYPHPLHRRSFRLDPPSPSEFPFQGGLIKPPPPLESSVFF